MVSGAQMSSSKLKIFQLTSKEEEYSKDHRGENDFHFLQATHKSCKQITCPPTNHNQCVSWTEAGTLEFTFFYFENQYAGNCFNLLLFIING